MAEDGPVIKSERGSVIAGDVKDSENVDLVEPSAFFVTHRETLETLQRVSTYVLYGALLVMIGVSLWIRMETAKFPFTLDPVAKACYWRNCPGTPLLVFALVLVVVLTIFYIRVLVLGSVEGSITSGVERLAARMGKTRKMKSSE